MSEFNQFTKTNRGYKAPRLVNYGGDTSKNWFIIYYVPDANDEDIFIRRRLSAGINASNEATERYKVAANLINQIEGNYTLKQYSRIIPKPKGYNAKNLYMNKAIELHIQHKKAECKKTATINRLQTLQYSWQEYTEHKLGKDLPAARVDVTEIAKYEKWLKSLEVTGMTLKNRIASLKQVIKTLEKWGIQAKNS